MSRIAEQVCPCGARYATITTHCGLCGRKYDPWTQRFVDQLVSARAEVIAEVVELLRSSDAIAPVGSHAANLAADFIENRLLP